MKVTKKIKDKQLEILEKTYAGAVPELIFNSPFELLISVILSAQCTDKRVNAVTAVLFKIANTPEQFLKLGQEKLEELIKSCGFYRMKSKNILAACEMLVKNYDGEVPDNFDELVKLPGVGRKTANVVTSVAFKTPAIAVDTHVFRISNRLQLAVGDTPLEVKSILLSHDSPYGCSDIVLDKTCPWYSGEHIGNPELKALIERLKPTINLHGHLHTTNHEAEWIGETEVRCVSVLDEQYKVAYKPYYFEI